MALVKGVGSFLAANYVAGKLSKRIDKTREKIQKKKKPQIGVQEGRRALYTAKTLKRRYLDKHKEIITDIGIEGSKLLRKPKKEEDLTEFVATAGRMALRHGRRLLGNAASAKKKLQAIKHHTKIINALQGKKAAGKYAVKAFKRDLPKTTKVLKGSRAFGAEVASLTAMEQGVSALNRSAEKQQNIQGQHVKDVLPQGPSYSPNPNREYEHKLTTKSYEPHTHVIPKGNPNQRTAAQVAILRSGGSAAPSKKSDPTKSKVLVSKQTNAKRTEGVTEMVGTAASLTSRLARFNSASRKTAAFVAREGSTAIGTSLLQSKLQNKGSKPPKRPQANA